MDNGMGAQAGSGGADGGSIRTDSSAFDRLPPQDLEAEMATLGGMLLSKEAITDVIDVLRGPEFYRSAHESIFDAIVEVYNRSEPADPLIVADELSKRGELERIGGAPYLATLMATVPTAANAGYYARIVKDKALMRGLVQAGTRITQLGYSTDAGDIAELVTLAEAEVYSVAHHEGEKEDYVAVSELLGEANLEIEAAQNRDNGALTGVPTGFIELDELTGGLHPGQMIIVAARPAMGKSTLAVDFCRIGLDPPRDHQLLLLPGDGAHGAHDAHPGRRVQRGHEQVARLAPDGGPRLDRRRRGLQPRLQRAAVH